MSKREKAKVLEVKFFEIRGESIEQIRNALQMILGEAQLTRVIETLTEKSQKNLGVIEKEVGRINRLLPDI